MTPTPPSAAQIGPSCTSRQMQEASAWPSSKRAAGHWSTAPPSKGAGSAARRRRSSPPPAEYRQRAHGPDQTQLLQLGNTNLLRQMELEGSTCQPRAAATSGRLRTKPLPPKNTGIGDGTRRTSWAYSTRNIEEFIQGQPRPGRRRAGLPNRPPPNSARNWCWRVAAIVTPWRHHQLTPTRSSAASAANRPPAPKPTCASPACWANWHRCPNRSAQSS